MPERPTITEGMLNLFTDDVDRALGFYRDLLGFDVRRRFPAEGPAEHAALRLGRTLLALSAPRAVTETGLRPSPGRTFELVLSCADVDAEVARLRAAGVDVLVAPYRHFSGHRRAYVADPAGNWLALVDVAQLDA